MKRWWLAGWIFVSGCGPSALTNAALKSDLPSLRAELQKTRAAGKLDTDAVHDLALAVARRELVSSQGEEAVARIRELRPCLGQLEEDAEDRAESDVGPGGATAALALLDAGYAQDDAAWVKRFAGSPDPMWRAVAARASRAGDALRTRTQLFIDGDLRVRRAALHAALETPQLSELDAALEAARLDPDPLARSLAIRVVGKLNDARAPRGLRDLWAGADEESKQVIVEAWASSPHADAQQHLSWVLETQTGLPQIVAAARAHRVPSLSMTAAGVLRRALATAPGDERILALRLAPLDTELLAPTETAARAADARVAVAASQKLLSYPGKREAALVLLRALAKHAQPAVAGAARSALVATGERSVLPDIKADLGAKVPEQRATAGEQLVALGALTDAASSLADDAATVRTRVACSILARR
jgi:HEAT repeat protein